MTGLSLLVILTAAAPEPIDPAAAARHVEQRDYEYLAKAVDARRLALFERQLDVVKLLIGLDQDLSELWTNLERLPAAQRREIDWDVKRQANAETELRTLIQRARMAATPQYRNLSEKHLIQVVGTKNPYPARNGIPFVGGHATFRGKTYTLTKVDSDGTWTMIRVLPTPEAIASFATEVLLWSQVRTRSLREVREVRIGLTPWLESLDELPAKVKAVRASFTDPPKARLHTAEEAIKLANALDVITREWSGEGDSKAAMLLRDLEAFRDKLQPVIDTVPKAKDEKTEPGAKRQP
jgi:hypothetical protein